MKYKHITFGVVFLFAGLSTHAQKTVSTTGGEATGTGGSASYTVGQVSYTANTGTNASVAEGVQQPYVVNTTFGEELKGIGLSLSAYPNPTTDKLILKVEDQSLYELSFELFDMEGKLLRSNKITNSTTTLGMEDMPKATYFLKVNDKKSTIKIFKIIKP